MEAPVYKITYGNTDSELYNISLVEEPAMDENFLAFSQQHPENEQFAVDQHYEQVITGAVLIPNKCILRYNKDNSPYYVFFTPETIRQLAMDFFKNGKHGNFNLNHSDQVIGHSVIIESWFSGASDKSHKYGFNCPEGTWFLSLYVPDREFFSEYILSGQVQGFSVEGQFSQVLADTAYNGQAATVEDTLNELRRLLKDV